VARCRTPCVCWHTINTKIPGTIVPGTIVPGTIVPGTIVPGTIVPGTSRIQRETVLETMHRARHRNDRCIVHCTIRPSRTRQGAGRARDRRQPIRPVPRPDAHTPPDAHATCPGFLELVRWRTDSGTAQTYPWDRFRRRAAANAARTAAGGTASVPPQPAGAVRRKHRSARGHAPWAAAPSALEECQSCCTTPSYFSSLR
jgi:hypothetical protein